MASQLSFAAQVDEWCQATEARMLAVFRESAQRVIAEMQKVGPSVRNPGGGAGGNMPVDTGFLRASLMTTLNNPSTEVKFKDSAVGVQVWDEGAVQLVILSAKIGDSVYAVYSAAYARRMEYGFSGTDSLGRTYNQSGYGFVRLAAQKWQTIVQEVVRDAKSRVGQ